MIPSPNCSARGPHPVRLVVIHTAEGARTTAELGAFFAEPSSQVSSHVGIDAAGVEQYVPYDQEAWTLRNGNPISDNAELCAYAALTREQWLSDDTVTFHHPTLNREVTVDHPRRILLNAAAWAAQRCQARGIPMVKLAPADVAAGRSGVIGHVDWTDGMHDGTHRDPGDGFPWPEFMAAVTGTFAPAAPPRPHVASEDTMYIRYQPDPTKPDVITAILSGGVLVGLNEREVVTAQAAIDKGLAVEQWVEAVTWAELDRRSKRLCRLRPDGTPDDVTVAVVPAAPPK